MAKIPKVLQSHINTAFPAHVCLVGSVLPNGFAQITPRGGTMVYDDDHLALWERGKGTTNANLRDGTALTSISANPNCASKGFCPRAGSPAFTAAPRSTNRVRFTRRFGAGWCNRKRTATRTRPALRC